MEVYLEALVEALGAANGDFLTQFRNVAQASITSGDQLARTTWAIGVHEALQNFGSALLSIASIVSFAKDFATNPKAFEDLTPVEMLDRLNSWVSALRSQESLINTLAKTQGAPTSNPITGKFDLAGGVDTKSINDQISTINDVKKTINAAIKNGKDWRKALKDSGGAAALGQLAGRFLKNYSEKLLKERQAAQQELLRDLATGDLAQAQAYRNLQRVQARRFLAEDALAAVRDARAAYQGCVQQVCGLFTVSRPAIPNFVVSVPGAKPKLSWGKALPWLNAAMAATLPRMNPVPFRNECMRAEEPEGDAIIIQSGSAEFCAYNPGQPPQMTPIGGPQITDGSDSGGTPAPGGETPGSAPAPTGGGGPTTTDDGDDPRDLAMEEADKALSNARKTLEQIPQLDPKAKGLAVSDLEGLWDGLITAIADAEAAAMLTGDPDTDAYTAARASGSRGWVLATSFPQLKGPFAAAIDAAVKAKRLKAGLDGSVDQPTDGGETPGSAPPPGSGDPSATDGGKEPESAPPPGGDPRDQPTETVKATVTALNATGQPVAGTRVALFGEGQMHVALPGAGADKPQTGAGADPMQCTTGADGTCQIEAHKSDLGLPANAPSEVNLAVADPAVKSFNLEVPVGTLPTQALTPFVTDQSLVGNKKFITVTAPLDKVGQLQAEIGQQPGVIAVEENICRDKEPAGLMPGCPVSAIEGLYP